MPDQEFSEVASSPVPSQLGTSKNLAICIRANNTAAAVCGGLWNAVSRRLLGKMLDLEPVFSGFAGISRFQDLAYVE
jgi:hypothetical protein